MELKENFLGCILGGAIGDALGAPIEFLSYNEIVEIYGPNGVESFVEYFDGKGEFTDDTQMLLFTAEGLLCSIHKNVLEGKRVIAGLDIEPVYFSYLRWVYTQGYKPKNFKHLDKGWLIKRPELFRPRSPGLTCISSLTSGKMGTVVNPLNNSKGCGTVMRIAPVGLLLNEAPELAFDVGVVVSAITHGHPSGYLSGGLLSYIIAKLCNGEELEYAINSGLDYLKQWDNSFEVYEILSDAINLHNKFSGKDISYREIESLGSGWVAEEALAIAILCSLHYRNDFRSAVVRAVNHSGDSDSTGAITGNIVGLIVGAEGIPDEWKQNLLFRNIVEQVAQDLFIRCKTTEIDSELFKKYPPY